MQTKDFAVGQIAYILGAGRRDGNGEARTAEVSKVGRKYVTVKENEWQTTRFYEPAGPMDCLVEDKAYGTPRLLFPTAEAVAKHKELNDLQDWLQEATNWMRAKSYTLAQLRAVKKILEGAD